MRVRRVTQLTLTLLVAAGLGVCVASAQKKSTSSKSTSTLHRSKSSKQSKRRERGQKTPTPDRVSEIQQALAKDGSFTRKPDGKWDASTIATTRKIQEAHGVNHTRQ